MHPRPTPGADAGRQPPPPGARRERRPTPAELLARLEAFGLSPADEPLAFETRLADHHGWTLGYALAVTAEYRRFLVLTQLAGRPMSPAPDVDEAWHLHLTRTSHYEQMCREVFGSFLHHDPARAGQAEVERHRDMYAQTLAAYLNAFGAEPPEAVWPRPGRRLPPEPVPAPRWTVPAALRPQPRLAWACVVSALVLCLLPGMPRLTWPLMALPVGVFLLGAAVIAGLLVWAVLRTKDAARAPHRRDVLEPHEVAWFGGGAARMAMTAVTALVERGVLQQPAEADRVGLPRHALAVDRGATAPARHPVEAACLRAATDAGLQFADACAAVKPLADACERRLAAAGLVADRGTMPLARARVLAAATLWLSICFERCWMALLHGDSAGERLLTAVVAGVTALLVVRLARRPSRVAARATQSLRTLVARHGRTKPIERVGDTLALGVALVGTAAFAGDLRFAGLDDPFGALGPPARRLARKKSQEGAGGSGFDAPSGFGSAFGGLFGASCGSPGVSSCGSGGSGGGGASWDAGGSVDLGGGSGDGGGGSSSSCGNSCSGGSSCSSGSSCGGGSSD